MQSPDPQPHIHGEPNWRPRIQLRQSELLAGLSDWLFDSGSLTRLGSRPMGEVLFTDPNVRRGRVEMACIQVGQRLHRRACGDWLERPKAIWGRRSLFRMDGQPLLVCEIVLPALPSAGSVSRSSTIHPS